MEEGDRVHFSMVVKREALFRFRHLVETRTELKYWTRGNSDRFSCFVTKFDESDIKWDTTLTVTEELPEKVYFHFNLSGIDYFGRALTSREKGDECWKFCISGNLYKAEKRQNQRVLVFPHIEAYFEIPNPQKTGKDIGSIISFGRRRPGTQTDLMIKFNELIGKTKNNDPYSLRIRIMDISNSGLSLKVGKETQEFFPPGCSINSCKIFIEGETYEIAQIMVKYRKHVKSDLFSSTEYYRVGIEFLDKDISVKNKLQKKIENLLNRGDISTEFEIFRSNR